MLVVADEKEDATSFDDDDEMNEREKERWRRVYAIETVVWTYVLSELAGLFTRYVRASMNKRKKKI